jgi:hypothetical protein
MRINHLIAFAGFVIIVAGTWCPILRPIPLVNWDVYQGNLPYGIVILLVAMVGIIGTVFSRQSIVRLAAWLSMGLIALFLLLSWLKIHTSFSFLPFRSWESYMIKHVRYKWGWYMLFGGAILALAGALFHTKPVVLRADKLV